MNQPSFFKQNIGKDAIHTSVQVSDTTKAGVENKCPLQKLF